jgi:Polyketide cyclase / dehydrase and lipid transport
MSDLGGQSASGASRSISRNAGLSHRRSRTRVPSLPRFTSRSFELHHPSFRSAVGSETRVATRVCYLMWAVEHSVETSARAQAVWRLWADVERWPEWNAGVERIELRGPFAVGSTILMTPPGDEPVELRIAETIEPGLFVDEADGGDFVVRTTHRVEVVGDERSRITYRMEITGPAAETVGPEIGPEVSGDFPEVLAALASRAEGLA